MTASPLRDAAGCLTEAGLDALEAASPGQAPEDLARHLAGCGRCQDRVLLRAGGAQGPRTRVEPIPRRRLWITVALVLATMLAALVSLLATLHTVRQP